MNDDLKTVTLALEHGTGDQPAIAETFLAAAAVALQKNLDYGSSFRAESPLVGVDAQTAILIRMGDKIKRIRTLSGQPAAVAGESLRDSMLDLANYALLWVLLEDEQSHEDDGNDGEEVEEPRAPYLPPWVEESISRAVADSPPPWAVRPDGTAEVEAE